jgi:hypothetical protein
MTPNQRKLAKLRERAAALRGSNTPDFSISDEEFVMRGPGTDTCFYGSHDGMGAEAQNPSGPSLDMGEVSKLNASKGGSFEINSPVNKVAFDGMVMNPRAKVAPPNIVNHYPLMMSQPPSIVTKQYQSVLKPLMSILKLLG